MSDFENSNFGKEDSANLNQPGTNAAGNSGTENTGGTSSAADAYTTGTNSTGASSTDSSYGAAGAGTAGDNATGANGTQNTGSAYGTADQSAQGTGSTQNSGNEESIWHNESRENGYSSNAGNTGSGYSGNGYSSNGYSSNGYSNSGNSGGYSGMYSGGYSNTTPNGSNGYYNTTQSPKPPKKHKAHPFAKRIGAVLLSAVLFGAVAGGLIVGIAKAGGVTGSSGVTIPTTTSTISSSGTESVSDLDVESIAAAVMPAMVELSGTITQSTNNYWFGGGAQTYATAGTGIIIGKSDDSIIIMTNAHVVTDVDDLQAAFVDGTSASATTVGSRTDKDVAVVKVKLSDLSDSTLDSIAVATLNTNSDALTVGQPVVAIGNALGEGQSVTSGIISATGRSITVNNYTYENLIQTDAAINSGNSGGALLNSAGEVIGINFAKSDDDGVQNMAYAIPVSDVYDLVESMSLNETREQVADGEQGFLGVSGVDITSSISQSYGYPQGLMIRYVQDGSAAAEAGLAEYDIITAVDDQSVTSQSGLSNLLKTYRAGETVTITYYHLEDNQYEQKTVDVTLGSRPQTTQN